MQVEASYLSSHRREGGTLENIAQEITNAAMTKTLNKIFAQTNPLTQRGAYEEDFSFKGDPGASCSRLQERMTIGDNKFSNLLCSQLYHLT